VKPVIFYIISKEIIQRFKPNLATLGDFEVGVSCALEQKTLAADLSKIYQNG
jgi:hypothetical protein